jgi:hypothetical protein
MLYFPQLVTGAIAQYPLKRKRRSRTALNVTQEGEEVKLGDPDDQHLEWELHLSGLTDEEWKAVEELFHGCEGSLRSFCFLDPTGNLLAWSGDLARTVWQREALLGVSPGIPDPFGGEGAARLVNLGQTEQTISQALDVPASFHYCLSLYVRSAAPGRVKLRQWSGSRARATEFEVTSSWRRIFQTAKLGGTEARVHFGLALPAGGSVEVYGLQVEPQRGASAYKESRERGGIYTNARFASDELRVRTDGVDSHSSVIRIAVNLKQS